MKKLSLKSQLLLGALLLGGGAAGANHLANLPSTDDPTYNWSRVSGSPQEGEMNPLNGATEAEAKQNYGCAGAAAICAIGVDPDGELDDAVIRFQ